MGRSRGSSSPSRSSFSSSRAAPAPVPARRPSPPPAPQQQHAAPPPAMPSSGGGMLSGIGSTIVQGMAFGTGSAIAHRAVGAVADSFSGKGEPATAGAESGAASYSAPPAAAAPRAPDCTAFLNDFNRCLNSNSNQLSYCQVQFDVLRECQAQPSL